MSEKKDKNNVSNTETEATSAESDAVSTSADLVPSFHNLPRDGFISIKQAHEFLNLSRSTFNRHRKEGHFQAIPLKHVRRTVLNAERFHVDAKNFLAGGEPRYTCVSDSDKAGRDHMEKIAKVINDEIVN